MDYREIIKRDIMSTDEMLDNMEFILQCENINVYINKFLIGMIYNEKFTLINDRIDIVDCINSSNIHGYILLTKLNIVSRIGFIMQNFTLNDEFVRLLNSLTIPVTYTLSDINYDYSGDVINCECLRIFHFDVRMLNIFKPKILDINSINLEHITFILENTDLFIIISDIVYKYLVAHYSDNPTMLNKERICTHYYNKNDNIKYINLKYNCEIVYGNIPKYASEYYATKRIKSAR
jgi:hypothetical protein